MIDIPENILPCNDQGESICPKCQKTVEKCTCPDYKKPSVKAKTFSPKIQLDKKGRRGKIVTIITHLPADESHLKSIAKNIKSQTGSGGTYYISNNTGTIEIQGDHGSTIQFILKNELL